MTTDIDFLKDLHKEFLAGRSKNDIEREEFGDNKSHGKAITAMWRRVGIETEKDHPLVIENAALRARIAELESV